MHENFGSPQTTGVHPFEEKEMLNEKEIENKLKITLENEEKELKKLIKQEGDYYTSKEIEKIEELKESIELKKLKLTGFKKAS